jgi:hypothetical protein
MRVEKIGSRYMKLNSYSLVYPQKKSYSLVYENIVFPN